MSAPPAKKGTKRAASPSTKIDAADGADASAASVSKKVKTSTSTSAAASSSSKRGRSDTASATTTITAESLSSIHKIPAGLRGEAFAIGSGDCSQLGLGADENMRERKKPTLLKALNKVSIVSIAVGSLHNLVLDSNFAVHSWGCNDDEALGRSTDEWEPLPVAGPLGLGNAEGGVEVVQIACGASHSLALTRSGEVYCWGTFRDANGVIGFSETLDVAKQPIKMTFAGTKHKIVMIAAGEHHDLALTEAGEVYQWGDIGIGRRFSDRKKKTKLTPSRMLFKKSGSIPAPKTIVKVSAGGSSSYALDDEGRAWFWGPNNYNQGGFKNPSKDQLMILIPRALPDLPKLQKVACAVHHSLFLTVDGDVYSTGRGEDGRLGHGDMKNYEAPTKIAALSGLANADVVTDIACGECHSLVITKLGRLYTFGYGDLLQLGNGVEEDVGEPYLVTSKEIDEGGEAGFGRQVLQASGGSQHSILLAVQRKVKAPWAAAKPVAAPAAAAAAASSSAPMQQ